MATGPRTILAGEVGRDDFRYQTDQGHIGVVTLDRTTALFFGTDNPFPVEVMGEIRTSEQVAAPGSGGAKRGIGRRCRFVRVGIKVIVESDTGLQAVRNFETNVPIYQKSVFEGPVFQVGQTFQGIYVFNAAPPNGAPGVSPRQVEAMLKILGRFPEVL